MNTSNTTTTKSDQTTPQASWEDDRQTLFEYSENLLAQSLLVFLLADLRLLSSTGRISTKYEWLAVDSDHIARSTAARLAGLTEEDQFLANIMENSPNEGISPAQIMAILFLELFHRVQKRQQNKTDDTDDDDDEQMLEGVGIFDNDLHSLLKAYSSIVKKDLKTDVPHVQAGKSTMRLFAELDAVTEEEEEQEDAQDDNSEQYFTTAELREKFQNLQSWYQLKMEDAKLVMEGEEAVDYRNFEEVTDAVLKMGESNEQVRQSLETEVRVSLDTEKGSLTHTEMLSVLQRAVESREYEGICFLRDFFKDGSVSQCLVQSQAKVVWFNDYYPLKDLTYAIAVDSEKKQVLVVFRGAITRKDWAAAYDTKLTKRDNPIEEDFDGKPRKIHLHKGVDRYLFRQRQDTNTTKFDEISNIAHQYGVKMIGDDYTLAVTGYSLGASLSTLFTFFASTEERFTRNGPIKCFTFGSPYVGGHTFADCFRHQEENNRLRYVRFYNHNDPIAHLPLNLIPSRRGSRFRHVGIGVKMPGIPCCCSGSHWGPSVFYVGNEGFCKSFARGIARNVLFHSPLPWRIRQMHSLAEMQRRIMYWRGMHHSKNKLLDMPLEKAYTTYKVSKKKK